MDKEQMTKLTARLKEIQREMKKLMADKERLELEWRDKLDSLKSADISNDEIQRIISDEEAG